MPIQMRGKGRKNPAGTVDKTSSASYTTTTFFVEDVDPDSDSSGIGGPSGSSSGTQFYSMTFTLDDEPGGIVGAIVQRVEENPPVFKYSPATDAIEPFTYLRYKVTLIIDPESTQRSITLGAPDPPAEGSEFANPLGLANFYFSSLDIGQGIAIAGSGNINGTLARDCLQGGDSNDTLDGKGGADYLRGGLGNDTYIVYDANTQIDETPRTGIETVESYVSWDLSRKVVGLYYAPNLDFEIETNVETGLDHLILKGRNAIDGTGNNLPNTIEGNNARNVLDGKNGNDTLVGNDGDDELNGFGTSASATPQFDTLFGGGGRDTFVLGGEWGVSYVEVGDGYAVIKDWESAWDQIKVKNVPGGFYSLESKRVSGVGSGARDTEIYFTDSSGFKDRIGIVQDTTDIVVERDFLFI